MFSKKTVAAVGAGALAGALGISIAGGAFTASASPAAAHKDKSSAAGKSAHHGKGEHGKGGHGKGGHGVGELSRVLHGTGVIKTKTGFETVAVDRGTVTAVSPTAVTIKSADGTSETFTPVSTSKYRVDGKKAALSDVKVGQTAGTLAVVKGADSDIKVLIVRPAKAGTGTGA